MMENKIIQVENIGKRYLLNHQNAGSYKSLRDVISDKTKSIIRPSKKLFSKTTTEEFWALKNVSFDVMQGDKVGIIGRNGAGKSTLLKILSRIVSPTAGRITLDGRVASLLEVGTGFHPELTGSENIFLNGSILGMSKSEIKSKFDEIVAFSEVEQFLDTPVKRYSSGMYVRLAFAVAAHLDPEILIVDEVLAVGDAEFQKKCLGKMKDVSSSGRTVLFVSHNMAAIQSLCDKAIYLYKGEVQQTGEAEKVIAGYLKDASKVQSINLADRQDRKGNGAIRFESVELKDATGNNLQSFQCGKDAVMQIYFSRKNNDVLKNLHFAVGLDDEYGMRITQFSNEVTNQIFNNVSSNIVEIKMEKLPLKRGTYSFVLYSTVNSEIADWIQQAGTIDVEAGDFFNTGKLPPEGQGTFYINHSFQLK